MVSSSTAPNVAPAARPLTNEECGSGPVGPDIFDPQPFHVFTYRYHNDDAVKNNRRYGYVVNVLEDREKIGR
jgi:hypothetical protein